MFNQDDSADPADEMALLREVILADGIVHDEELKVYASVAKAYGLNAVDEASLWKAVDEIGVQSGAMPSLHGTSRSRRNMVVRHMIAIAKADGVIHEKERNIIRIAAERLLRAVPGKPVETV